MVSQPELKVIKGALERKKRKKRRKKHSFFKHIIV